MPVRCGRAAGYKSKQAELAVVLGGDVELAAGARLRGGHGDGGVVGLELGEDHLGAVDHGERQAGEAGHLDTVAAVGGEELATCRRFRHKDGMSDATPKTKPKLLVILGAGSSVELGMPSVKEIDRLMMRWAGEYAADKQQTDFYRLVWRNRICNLAGIAKRRQDVAWENIVPNYEKCLGDMLSLINAVLPHPIAEPLQHSLLSDDFLQKHGLTRTSDTAKAIRDQCGHLVERLAAVFRQRCLVFQSGGATAGKHAEYRGLFKTLEQHFDLGVYNLNHDNVALKALTCPDSADYFTGFEEGRFNPKAVHARTAWRFLYHLHGSVHQSFPARVETEISLRGHSPILWHSDLAEGKFDVFSTQPIDQSWRDGDGHVILKTTLVAGGWKLDQLQIDPYQTFYSTLARHAHEADAILIAGYSFGDQHVNAVIRNALGARPKNRPSVMVLDFDGRRVVDEDGRAIKGRLLCERGDSWPFSLVGALALGLGFPAPFRPVDSLWITPRREASFLSQEVNQFEVWSDAEPAAVWFGGMLAAAARKEEIANWLLRHVPGRSGM